MDNANRRNIHARTACRDGGVDRQALPPDKGDGASTSNVARPPDERLCDLLRRDCSEWACNVPYSPHAVSVDPSPQLRRETGLYGAAGNCASPTWGRIVKNLRGGSRTARRRMPLALPYGRCHLQYPSPAGMPRPPTRQLSPAPRQPRWGAGPAPQSVRRAWVYVPPGGPEGRVAESKTHPTSGSGVRMKMSMQPRCMPPEACRGHMAGLLPEPHRCAREPIGTKCPLNAQHPEALRPHLDQFLLDRAARIDSD